jgi:predicted nucleotidyltransferase
MILSTPGAAWMGEISAQQQMGSDKLRREIAFEAARLMYDRHESEYMRAKIRAARKICRGWVKDSELPSNREIRDQIQQFARMYEGDQRTDNLRDMRLEGLRMMRLLASFKPKLIGSVLTGHIRHGSDIDIHLFCDRTEPIEAIL